jgi:hypothetical protein
MLGFDIRAEDIHYPINDNYRQPLDNIERRYGPAKPKWAFKPSKHYCRWQGAKEGEHKVHTTKQTDRRTA